MTKLIALRVTMAVDDAVDVKDAKFRLSALIAERGTEVLGENGAGGRIHWGTAEVLQGPERVTTRRGGGSRRTNTGDQLDIPVPPAAHDTRKRGGKPNDERTPG